MNFEPQVRKALNGLLADQNARVVIDSTRVLQGEDDCVVMVSYHLEGELASPAQFTFPFIESVPMEENLDAFLDYGSRNWRIAQFAPGELVAGQGTSYSAGAD